MKKVPIATDIFVGKKRPTNWKNFPLCDAWRKIKNNVQQKSHTSWLFFHSKLKENGFCQLEFKMCWLLSITFVQNITPLLQN